MDRFGVRVSVTVNSFRASFSVSLPTQLTTARIVNNYPIKMLSFAVIVIVKRPPSCVLM